MVSFCSSNQDWEDEREHVLSFDFSELRRPELTHAILPPASLRENVIPFVPAVPIQPTPRVEEEPEIFVCYFICGGGVSGCRFESRRALYTHARFCSHKLRHVLSSLVRTNQFLFQQITRHNDCAESRNSGSSRWNMS